MNRINEKLSQQKSILEEDNYKWKVRKAVHSALRHRDLKIPEFSRRRKNSLECIQNLPINSRLWHKKKGNIDLCISPSIACESIFIQRRHDIMRVFNCETRKFKLRKTIGDLSTILYLYMPYLYIC